MARKPPVPAPSPPPATWQHLDEIVPWDKNPRVNDLASGKVAASIKRFGFPTALVVWPAERMLVAGHARVKALRALLAADPGFALAGAPGPGFVPVRAHAFASRAEAEAYALADNRLAEEADWDLPGLRDALVGLGEDADFGGLGFEDDELSRLLGAADAPVGEDAAGSAPAPSPEVAFKAFDETAAKDVKMATCPHCAKQFPL